MATMALCTTSMAFALLPLLWQQIHRPSLPWLLFSLSSPWQTVIRLVSFAEQRMWQCYSWIGCPDSVAWNEDVTVLDLQFWPSAPITFHKTAAYMQEMTQYPSVFKHTNTRQFCFCFFFFSSIRMLWSSLHGEKFRRVTRPVHILLKVSEDSISPTMRSGAACTVNPRMLLSSFFIRFFFFPLTLLNSSSAADWLLLDCVSMMTRFQNGSCRERPLEGQHWSSLQDGQEAFGTGLARKQGKCCMTWGQVSACRQTDQLGNLETTVTTHYCFTED